ncbi:MAG: hypothetical protein WD159_01000, partial [Patescibacteria group bacterium]
VRLSFPRERWVAGLLWVWIGTAAEVATWFLPLYGGASLVIRFVVSLFGQGWLPPSLFFVILVSERG